MIRHSLNPVIYNKWTEIDADALRHNLKILRGVSALANPRIMAIVKANAYGHNISLLAPLLVSSGIRNFGVATLSEALYLKELLTPAEYDSILILSAQIPQLYAHIIAQEIDFILHTPEDLSQIERTAQLQQIKAQVHLKVDTGMGRVGIQPKDVPDVLNTLKTCEHITLKGICSHLATSDEHSSDYLKQQLSTFQSVKKIFMAHPLRQRQHPLFHLANSDATLNYPETHFDLVRPGIALYGYQGASHSKLKPILALKTIITQYKEVPAGSSIGYGCSFTTSQASRLAVIAIGYADGVNRLLSNQQDVLIEAQRVPMVGRISMDQIVIDLTQTQLQGTPGTEVTLIGQSGDALISAREWADTLKTIPYEILTGLGTRLPRYLK